MATDEEPPPWRARMLGKRLKAAREEKALTVPEAAQRLRRNEVTLYRNESGFSVPTKKALDAYIDLYRPNLGEEFESWVGASEPLTDEEAAALSVVRKRVERETQSTLAEWENGLRDWHALALRTTKDDGGIGQTFSDYAHVENMATAIRCWTTVIPGLAQTSDYAQAVIAASSEDFPRGTEPQILLRERRRQRLTGPTPPTYQAVVDEAALVRRVGSAEVMRRQADHLVTLVESSLLDIRILPFAAGANLGMAGAFDIFEVGPDTVIFREGYGDGLFIDSPKPVQQYAQRFDHLKTIAWSAEQSLRHLKALARTTTRRKTKK